LWVARKNRAVLNSLFFLAGVITCSAGAKLSSALVFTSTKTTAPSGAIITRSISPVLQEKFCASLRSPFRFKNLWQRFSPHRPSSFASANSLCLFSSQANNFHLSCITGRRWVYCAGERVGPLCRFACGGNTVSPVLLCRPEPA